MTQIAEVSPPMPSVAIVDDDPTVRALLRHWVAGVGYVVSEYDQGLPLLEPAERLPDVVCLDLGLGDVSGMRLIAHLRARDPEVPILVITAEQRVEVAVAAMRAGAYDYLTKPLDRERVTTALHRAVERRRLQRDVKRLQSALGDREVREIFLGQSAAVLELQRQVKRVIDVDVPLTIIGEAGSGREQLARAIHQRGRRSTAPFVVLDATAVPAALHEAELSYADPASARLEQARGGTLFIDHVAELSPAAQRALLVTLDAERARRAQGDGVRILVGAPNELRADVDRGRFAEELYFRLVVYPLFVPPLRERLEDLPLLVAHLLDQLGDETGRRVERIEADALDALSRHRWPGNAAELENVIHRSLLACAGRELRLGDLPPHIRELALPVLPEHSPANDRSRPVDHDGELRLDVLEQRAIERALRIAGGSVGKAAKLLGIGRATLYRRLGATDTSGAA
jgi:DNA-binding NtrC family response regulator